VRGEAQGEGTAASPGRQAGKAMTVTQPCRKRETLAVSEAFFSVELAGDLAGNISQYRSK